ncbi:MAG: FtsK/SpoIIIE domain-containing protein, partial [Bdellovibrionales bacterium]|nr:FtsK/SpoIIIE domain-containing protein [Bdellovibrionales bacterium]
EFSTKSLPLVLGRRADNEGVIEDLARIPHLLIAGTTGSGKSQFVISFITSLLFRHTPETLRMILIDPKQVDLSSFKDVPHLLSPPIVSVGETISALRWAIAEMEKRYRSLAQFGVRDLNSFNKIAGKLSIREQKEHEEWNRKSTGSDDYYYQNLPQICLIIEEFGDLMTDPQFKRSIEMCVVRLAQKARASGIHLVLAMQSPRKDVITGLIKTNIPGRISFKVASGTDSRVILDEVGAERLLSHGDMLFLQPGASKPLRFHGPFISEEDVSRVVNYWKELGEPEYISDLRENKAKSQNFSGDFSDSEESDPMYEEILNYVQTCSSISASFLQRKFRIGYPRAARLIEILYEEGVIGPPQGSKPREVLTAADK